jgi:hypothetical protein
MLRIISFASRTWKKYLLQGNGVKSMEAKYKISLEHGKEDMSIACKSLTAKLPHR